VFPGKVESGGSAVDHPSLLREGAVGVGGIAMKLLNRVKAILLKPHAEWLVIAGEKSDASALFLRYVAILALIPALARFIGASLVGRYAPISWSLAGALLSYLSGFAIVYVLALIIDVLAPRFGAQKDFAGALKLAVYSATPVWIAGIFLLVPGLSFLVILGLHGAYLLWAGLPILMQAPADKALSYTAVVAGCGLIIAIGLGLIEAPLFSAPG
jgi:Yip1 domain